MELFEDFIVLVVMGICYCIGFLVKYVVQSEKVDRFIPLICGLCGVFFNIWVNNWTIDPGIILGGLVSGLAATGANQIFKQLSKDSDEDIEN